MRLIYFLLIPAFLLSCEGNLGDCLSGAGDPTSKEFSVGDFTQIDVHDNIDLTIVQGAESKVTIYSTKNLIGNISVEVVENELVLMDLNICDFVREYGLVSAVIELPKLTKVRCSGGSQIRTEGVISGDNLVLVSERSTGDFTFEINYINFRIVSNNLSNYYISGAADFAKIGFYAGDGRYEGKNLEADRTEIFHRGTNDMVLGPTTEIKGKMVNTGDVYYIGSPNDIDVEITGRGAIYRN